MKLGLSLFAAVIVVQLTACATPEAQPSREEWDPTNCNHQAGYERGYNDGLQGQTMNSKFSVRCREDLRAEVVKGYNKGYRSGTKKKEAEREAAIVPDVVTTPTPPITPTMPPQNSSMPNININIGNGKQTVGNPGAGGGISTPTPVTPNPKAYFCSVSAFMKTFKAFGPTLLEAKQSTLGACTESNHEMHCRNIQCQKNE